MWVARYSLFPCTHIGSLALQLHVHLTTAGTHELTAHVHLKATLSIPTPKGKYCKH